VSQSIPLQSSASVVLNGSGDGTVTLGPSSPGVVWYPATVAVQVATNVSEATGYLYVGVAEAPGNLIGTTQTASTGDSDDLPGYPVYPGTFLIFSWSGGDAGQVATMTVFGSQTVPSPRG
jgi:hypothetical protein